MWIELKKNLLFSRIFLKEILLFVALLVVITLLLVSDTPTTVFLIIVDVILSFFLLLFLGFKSRKKVEEVEKTISEIRNNISIRPEDIHLSKHLPGLQEEIKMMFEKMRNDIEYLKKLEKMRKEFLGNVSHELRTPIFAIQGFIETLMNGAINDPTVNMNFLAKANQYTLDLNNLLNDLIDISMIETGEMRMSFRYFNIDPYLSSLVEEFRDMAEEKKIELIYYPVRQELQLFGDRNKLKQVFTNLIQNAIKYTEKGKVEIKIEEEARKARISVIDTGIGIPESDLNRVFERFYRVDKARSRAVGGTGLGLAIVKHIIEAHGSHIHVNSKIDQGSEFYFYLKK